ncbi:MAG: N-acetyltransferase [Promethearchaeota archaeon]|nr:MAG: N-acetyltransferase [Candidatus Lokiarchaeota archaeon]
MDKARYKIKLIDDSQEILKNLKLGTHIPIWNEFYKYILYDLNCFKAKALYILKNAKIISHALLYHINKETLYFGFFKVYNDEDTRINQLIKEIISYAKTNNFSKIIGPINIPTIIFGWGFMNEGSSETIFIAKPVHSPNYLELFLKNNFIVQSIQQSWEGNLPRITKKRIKKYNFDDYEFLILDDWNKFNKIKNQVLNLISENLSSQSIVNPSPKKVFNNYVNFVIEFGEPYMFAFIKYKESGKIVACSLSYPNPFSKDEEGFYNSFSPFVVAVDKNHRKKGLGMILAKKVFDLARKNKIRYLSTPVEKNVKVMNIGVQKIFQFKNLRQHMVLEFLL